MTEPASHPGIQHPNKLTTRPKIKLRKAGKPPARYLPSPPRGKFTDVPGQLAMELPAEDTA